LFFPKVTVSPDAPSMWPDRPMLRHPLTTYTSLHAVDDECDQPGTANQHHLAAYLTFPSLCHAPVSRHYSCCGIIRPSELYAYLSLRVQNFWLGIQKLATLIRQQQQHVEIVIMHSNTRNTQQAGYKNHYN